MDSERRLSALVPLRADIIGGDHRSLYLGWLLRVQAGELEADDPEPPCPPGLAKLSASLEHFAAFFQIDVDAFGAGIQRVFDQFLDHRGRPLDDLAGGNLVDQGIGELADAHPPSLACETYGAPPAPTLPAPAAACCRACARAAYSVPGGGWLEK